MGFLATDRAHEADTCFSCGASVELVAIPNAEAWLCHPCLPKLGAVLVRSSHTDLGHWFILTPVSKRTATVASTARFSPRPSAKGTLAESSPKGAAPLPRLEVPLEDVWKLLEPTPRAGAVPAVRHGSCAEDDAVQTHFDLAVAYGEMGLSYDAIQEAGRVLLSAERRPEYVEASLRLIFRPHRQIAGALAGIAHAMTTGPDP